MAITASKGPVGDDCGFGVDVNVDEGESIKDNRLLEVSMEGALLEDCV